MRDLVLCGPHSAARRTQTPLFECGGYGRYSYDGDAAMKHGIYGLERSTSALYAASRETNTKRMYTITSQAVPDGQI